MIGPILAYPVRGSQAQIFRAAAFRGGASGLTGRAWAACMGPGFRPAQGHGAGWSAPPRALTPPGRYATVSANTQRSLEPERIWRKF
jgi:hypothetical protein